MNVIDVDKLIVWLGPEGAIAGLEASNVTVPELCELASTHSSNVDKKMKRNEVINELINRKYVRIEKHMDELLAMDQNGLKKYIEEQKVSRTELLNLLSKFGIRPGSDDKKNLVNFAAREISDLGMYQRVAKGTRGG